MHLEILICHEKIKSNWVYFILAFEKFNRRFKSNALEIMIKKCMIYEVKFIAKYLCKFKK